MSSENKRDEEERDEDERDEDEDEARADAVAREEAEAGPDPNVARNRAERRAAAKAARRGRTAQLSDPSLAPAAPLTDEEGLIAPTTSMGGSPKALDDVAGTKRPRVPPRTMSKGTGDTEGVPQWAKDFANWFSVNRTKFAGGLLVVGVVVGGAVAWQNHTLRRETRAADAYTQALEAWSAPVLPEDPPADQANRFRGPRFRTEDERARAAVDKFRRAEQQHPTSRMAPLAKLSEAGMLYQLGRYAEARQLYQSLLGQNLAGLEGRALEGLAFTLEAMGDLEGAAARYRELQNAQGGLYRDQAQFYMARLYARRDDPAHAKDILHSLTERLARVSAAEPTAATQQQLREQAFTLLRDIDPQDPVVVAHDRANTEGGGDDHEHGGRGGDPLQNLPPELREQLRQALQRSKQGR